MKIIWFEKKAYCLQFYKDIEWGKCYSSKLASHIVFHSVCYVQIEWMLWNYEACSSWMGHFAISDIVYRKIVHTYSVMKNKQIDIIQYKKKTADYRERILTQHTLLLFRFVQCMLNLGLDLWPLLWELQKQEHLQR